MPRRRRMAKRVHRRANEKGRRREKGRLRWSGM